RLVKDHVALQSVRADDIIVVSVLYSPDDSASLVFVAANWLELHFDKAILDRDIQLRGPRKRRLAGLAQHVWFAWRGRLRDYFPLGAALSGDAALPALRQLR